MLFRSYKTTNSIRNNFVADKNKVYACDMEGILYAIDQETGTEIWKNKLHDFLLSPYDQGICIEDNIIYAGQGSGLCAIDANSGNILWRNKSWQGGEGTVSTNVVNDSILYTSSYWRGRYAHDIKDGKLLWHINDHGTNFCMSAVTVYDNKLYYTSPEYIFELDPKTGKKLRMIKTEKSLSTSSAPVIDNGIMIQGTTDNGVIAYNLKDITPIWNFETKPSMFYTSPYSGNGEKTVSSTVSIKNDRIYFGANDGWFYCIDKNTGKLINKHYHGTPILSKSVIDGE